MNRVPCARCYRMRYVDRMTMIGPRVRDERELFVCIARASCRVARKAHRRAQRATTS